MELQPITLLVGATLFLATAMLTLDHASARQNVGGAKSGATPSGTFRTEDEKPVVIVGHSSKDRDVMVRGLDEAKDGTFRVQVYDESGKLLFETTVTPGNSVTVGVPRGGSVAVVDDDSGTDDKEGASGTYDLL